MHIAYKKWHVIQLNLKVENLWNNMNCCLLLKTSAKIWVIS